MKASWSSSTRGSVYLSHTTLINGDAAPAPPAPRPRPPPPPLPPPPPPPISAPTRVVDEPSHTYTVDGDVISGSVSSLWGSRFEQFDALGTARRCYPKWTQKAERGFEADVWTYTERYVRLMEGGDDAAVAAAGVPGPVSVGEKG